MIIFCGSGEYARSDRFCKQKNVICVRADTKSHQLTFSSLPVGAQAGISAAVGRNTPSYRVRVDAHGLHAENVRQKLSADFAPDGVDVRSGYGDFRMQARAYGYANN